MQALILAGGKGNRLHPLTLSTPKPIVPIGNKPLLVYQIIALEAAGISDITISLNYQPTIIEKAIGDGSKYGVNLRYVVEPTPMGTAGAYKFAEKHLKTTTIVLNGDILTDINFQAIINQHQRLKADATIVLTKVENPFDYGLVEIDSEARVIRFFEKPGKEESDLLNINTINAGIYVFETSILNYIPINTQFSFEYQLFPKLLEKKANFYSFVNTNSYWIDIGTPDRYLQANADLIDGKIKCKSLD